MEDTLNLLSFRRLKKMRFRRDFTVNGIFYDPVKDKVIDFVGRTGGSWPKTDSSDWTAV